MSEPTTAAGQSSDPAKKVPTRRMSFEESVHALPRHFAGDGDLISGHVIAALSSVFRDGEDSFVRSVRRFRDQITDPALTRQVAGRLLSAKSNLAATAALAHVTATLAELVLSNEEIRHQMGAEAVRDLFVWHALEESEHKAVAFDVYRAVGGGERLRVFTMNVFRFGFVVGLALAVVVSLLGDPATYEPRALRESWRRVRRSPIMDPAIWSQLKDYNRRDFHPDDSDTSQLVEAWRTELFGEHGSLNDKLIGAAA